MDRVVHSGRSGSRPGALRATTVDSMTDDTAIYTAHDIEDLLNAVPALLGFRPEESIVAVATEGPECRLGFCLRMDLPALEYIDPAAEELVRHLRNHHAEGAVVVAMTQRQALARELLAAVEAQLGDIEPVVMTRADGRRYWVDVPGFPDRGMTYETSDHHEAVVSAVVAGQEVLASREALVQRFAAATGDRMRQMARVFDQVLPDVFGLMHRTRGSLAPAALADLGPVLAAVERGDGLDDAETARLCCWVTPIEVRDAVWSRITTENAQQWLAALTHAARCSPPPFAPAVLSLASFAAWRWGSGAQAVIAAERALEIDPEYSRAHLMLALLDLGLAPGAWDEIESGCRAG